MKNSDMFNLPLSIKVEPFGEGWIISDTNGKFIANVGEKQHAEAIVWSVNEYDRLKAEIEKDKEIKTSLLINNRKNE